MRRSNYRKCLAPFEHYRSRGPYLHTGEGRNHVLLQLLPGLEATDTALAKSIAMAYSRYLVCVKEGRRLSITEHVDHVDEDRTHDMVANLQILGQSENSRKAHANDYLGGFTRNRTTYRFTCLHCLTVFQKKRGQSHLGKGGHATYCSKTCAAHAGEHMGEPQKYEPVPQSELQVKKMATVEPKNLAEDWDAYSAFLAPEYQVMRSKGKMYRCARCGKSFRGQRKKEYVESDTVFCSKPCASKDRGSRIPSASVVKGIVARIVAKKTTWTAAGREYGVSDNAVRKWAKMLGLMPK